MPKSKRKEKFVFLKHILGETDGESGKDKSRKKDTNEISLDSAEIADGGGQKRKVKVSGGPTGKYPVLFTKTCKNKSCQTKLSSFPLFPLPEETGWISDAEGEKRKTSASLKLKKKQRRSEKTASKNVTFQDHHEDKRHTSKVKNSDGIRKNFRSEHQLKDSDNPVLLAWLHKKAIIARKQRKLERKEKGAKRAALEEEARLKAEREVESSEKVSQWLRRKKKEARRTWRKNCARVGPQRGETVPLGCSSPHPPCEYQVVSTFQCSKSFSVVEKSLTDHGNENNSLNLKNINKVNKEPIAPCSPAASESLENCENGDTILQNYSKKLFENSAASTVDKIKFRPKTAVNSNDLESNTRPKAAGIKRPKTARGKSSKSDATPAAEPSNVLHKKMQSLSYDEWLRVKREEEKDKVIQKKRELIDSHLDAVIKELGKKRVDKILSPRKQVDTGLKNFSRSSERGQSPGPNVKKDRKYKWVTSRPEPQGCDNPELQGSERTLASSCQQRIVDKNAGGTNLEVQVKSDSDQEKLPEAQICQEVNSKYNVLKPSIEKVKDILDAEIKKVRESGRHSKQTIDKSDRQTVELPQARPKTARPMTARPSTARPGTAQAASVARHGNAVLTEKQSKKIADNMDILGLFAKDQERNSDEMEDLDVRHDEKSTVRVNYFDYGSEVDSPITTPPELVE